MPPFLERIIALLAIRSRRSFHKGRACLADIES